MPAGLIPENGCFATKSFTVFCILFNRSMCLLCLDVLAAFWKAVYSRPHEVGYPTAGYREIGPVWILFGFLLLVAMPGAPSSVLAPSCAVLGMMGLSLAKMMFDVHWFLAT